MWLISIIALGTILLSQYSVPACENDNVTGRVVEEVSHQMRTAELQFTDVRNTSRGLFLQTRHCELDVAPIISGRH
jgi:hypothetical protein